MNHYYTRIHGWFNFQDIYSFAANLFPDNSLFVEIGSWKGMSSVYMGVELINLNKKNTNFICIDTWGLNDDGEYLNEESIIKDTLYSEFLTNIKPLQEAGLNINHIRDSSHNAVHSFRDNSIDFLYIDGSHLYANVKKDIELYFNKVKNDGIIAGHDWQSDDVRRAVEEFFGKDVVSLLNNSWLIKVKKHG